jgi:threonine/homoserine/homoserine lactone efflux protein
MAAHGWLVTALNPKSITFFVAFLPQFLDPKGDLVTQMAIFQASFLALAFCNVVVYAAGASRARGFVGSPRALRAVNRVGGSLLIGAGVAAVSVRQA